MLLKCLCRDFENLLYQWSSWFFEWFLWFVVKMLIHLKSLCRNFEIFLRRAHAGPSWVHAVFMNALTLMKTFMDDKILGDEEVWGPRRINRYLNFCIGFLEYIFLIFPSTFLICKTGVIVCSQGLDYELLIWIFQNSLIGEFYFCFLYFERLGESEWLANRILWRREKSSVKCNGVPAGIKISKFTHRDFW